ncbi:Pheophytinase, chloroplastic [Linum perenne]
MSSSCAVSSSIRSELFNSRPSRLAAPTRLNPSRSRCEMSRRGFAMKGIVASSISAAVATESKNQGVERLPFKSEGYNFWTWKGRRIHYIVEGEGPPIVLVHGFGASAFHWSLGGFTALISAVGLPEQVTGVVLLNSAGQFGNPNMETKESEESVLQKYVLKPVKEVFQRIVLGFLFWQAKQPARVESVLKSVYVNKSNVDDYLVKSIIQPADDPNAGEVYYRLMSRFMVNQTTYTLDSALSKLRCPLLLIWGDLDPWVGPAKAKRIKEFYPNTTVVNLQAGHCPHDEVPELVNKALIDWLASLNPEPSLQTM